jgi:hypothetical protein
VVQQWRRRRRRLQQLLCEAVAAAAAGCCITGEGRLPAWRPNDANWRRLLLRLLLVLLCEADAACGARVTHHLRDRA